MSLSFFVPDTDYECDRDLHDLKRALGAYLAPFDFLRSASKRFMVHTVAEHGDDDLFVVSSLYGVSPYLAPIAWAARCDVQRRYPGLVVVSDRQLRRDFCARLVEEAFGLRRPSGEVWDLSRLFGSKLPQRALSAQELLSTDVPLPLVTVYLPALLTRNGYRERVFEELRRCTATSRPVYWQLVGRSAEDGCAWRVKLTSLEVGPGFFPDEGEAVQSASRYAESPRSYCAPEGVTVGLSSFGPLSSWSAFF